MSRAKQEPWTLEQCQESAKKSTGRGEWSVNHHVAYEAARKNGWLNLCLPKSKTRLEDLTLEQARVLAAPFNSRRQFQMAHSGEYQKAKRMKWLEEITAHYTGCKKPDNYWTMDRCREEALRQGSVKAFKRNAGSAYQKCSEMQWGAEVYWDLPYEAMPSGYWTKDMVLEEAKKYEYRTDFKRGSNGAYGAALRDGYADEAMAHMSDRRAGDYDAVYLWRAVDESYGGKKVYKIGITSARLKDQRVLECANANGMGCEILCLRYVGAHYASTLEEHLLQFGEDPKLDVPNGRTEFRALTDDEVKTVVHIIESHPIHI